MRSLYNLLMGDGKTTDAEKANEAVYSKL